MNTIILLKILMCIVALLAFIGGYYLGISKGIARTLNKVNKVMGINIKW